LLVLVAIVKNEGKYLIEWIAHHHAIGVDHFIILDNESTDGTFFLLRPLADAGIITYFRWDTKLKYKGFEAHNIGPQVPAYDFAFKVAKKRGRWDWIGFIDLDEFVLPVEDDTITGVLSRFEQPGAVGINWRMFGSSGHVDAPNGLVIENFTRRAPDEFDPNRHVKSIVRMTNLGQPGIHIPNALTGDIVDMKGNLIARELNGIHDSVVFEGLVINHYFTKSQREWEQKRARGRATKSISDKERERANSMFFEYDRNEVEDRAILRFLPSVRREIAELNKIISSSSSGPWLPMPTGTS
jgi:hypothetical protein